VTAHDGTGTGAGRREVALRALSAARADDDVHDLPAVLQRICRAATASLGLAGASVQLLNRPDGGGVVASSDDVAHAVGEAAFTVGEGPSLDAYSQARPVFAPYLLDQGQHIWPGYVSAIRESGVRACFSRPLHVGAVRLGVLDLYAADPGPLDPDQVSLALTFADLAVERLLDPDPGTSSGDVNARLVDALERRAEIHQAQGMVMVDLEVDLAGALSLMRAHAFSRDVSLIEVAREILAGGQLPSPDGSGAG
jgi:hypothetical protein